MAHLRGVQLFGILFISFIQFRRISKKKNPLGVGGGGRCLCEQSLSRQFHSHSTDRAIAIVIKVQLFPLCRYVGHCSA
jgi:hypothetical protein